ncbi:hypothetical protein EUTSA_v10004716mg [Eutrema salsugineum]|uniref:adenylate kinase n=1 Tax=Eutrema salsugineum TaxID=72664 RepID=V4K576_EUTSA|nr:adenylate kinase 2, chloroplastic [Eutrema salsugineum]XP_024007371.1 adenylate kinase 2, chloroplastic [Eutrema salsugineum]ESQ32690.1 hypothetical protein EUTSA_v10004716mg [Eutrema salsugineum]
MASCVNSPAMTLCPPCVSPSKSLCCSISFNKSVSRSSFSSTRNALLCLRRKQTATSFQITALAAEAAAEEAEPLRIIISGAPASGKGTQCELITQKYGLVQISAGGLLRAEIDSGSENGRLAKEFMEKGELAPDEILVTMVKEALSKQNGWLLDGYPRSLSQATSLKRFGFEPDLFILLEVPEDILIDRVIGRRLDPVTGKIYHLKYSLPETEEIAARLTQRFDDTKEKVKLRLKTHNRNVRDVLSMYRDITVTIKGNCSKEEVFGQIDMALTKLVKQGKTSTSRSLAG